MNEVRDISIHQIRDRDILRNLLVDLDTESFSDNEARVKIDRGIQIHENTIFHEFSHDFRDRYSDLI